MLLTLWLLSHCQCQYTLGLKGKAFLCSTDTWAQHKPRPTDGTRMHDCMHARTHKHTLCFLPPCTASGESSLYSRHQEMSAPCDRPVSSSHTDLCGTSQLFVSPLMETMYACSLLGRFTQLIMGGASVEALSDGSREKRPCLSKQYDGFMPVQHHISPFLLISTWMPVSRGTSLLSHCYPFASRDIISSYTQVFSLTDMMHWATQGQQIYAKMSECLSTTVPKCREHYSLYSHYYTAILYLSLCNQFKHGRRQTRVTASSWKCQ